MSRLIAPSTSNITAPITQSITKFVHDHIMPGAASHDAGNSKMSSKNKLIAPAVSAAAPNSGSEEIVRTRDAFVTALTGLSSSLDKFAKAYLEHSEAVIDAGGVLDIGPALAPLSKVISGVAPIASTAIAPGFNPVNGVEMLAVEEAELDADGKKKKRKRNTKPRDPNAPKRPMTAYFRFMQEQRPLLVEEFKNEPVNADGVKTDINKLATERWRALSDAEREQYAAAYRKDRQIYEEEMKTLGLPVGKADMHEVEAEHDEVAVAGGIIPVSLDEVVMSDPNADVSSDEEEAPTPPPVVSKSKAKAASAETAAAKKTPKQAPKKKAKDAIEVATPSFNSINQGKSAAAAPASSEPPASSPARKRKAAKAEVETAAPAPKKRGRKSVADKAADDAAAASAQLEEEDQPAPEAAKPKKDRKKKRKSEAAE